LAYRFVHAADIHLDSPMRSLALRDPELAELIGNATRRAFVAIVDLCLAEKVDALLLAGDLYDDSQTSMKTARFLSEQLRRLHEAGIRVFIIRGNHDAMSKITKELTFPDSVTLFGSKAEIIAIEGAPVAIHGLSFAKPLMPESLLPQYQAPAEDTVNIGLMHTSLDGAAGHQPYAPCSMTDLRASGFRYWALGHIHKRSAAEGDCTVVMPGIPQGRDINEAGAKSVTLVTIGDDRSIRIEEHLTSIAQFERVAVDASGIADWPELIESIATAMQSARELAVSPHLVARLRLFGATPLAWRIRRDLDLLEEEAKARASLAGQCWIEKVEIECSVPGATAGSPDNPVSELRRLIDEDVVGSDAYQAEVERIAAEMRSQLPQECRGILGMDEASGRAAIAGLVRDGADDVLARLHGGAETEEAA
jgi:DNA repair exonuclease SbcCD nuclease subunit